MADHQLTCRGCGKQFTFHRRKGYCSLGCRPSLAHVGRDRHANAACRQEHECYACGLVFKPKRAGRTTTCSQRCGRQWAGIKAGLVKNGGRVWVRRKVKRLVAPLPATSTCAQCGASYVKCRPYQRRCSDACDVVFKSAAIAARRDAQRYSPSRRKAKSKRKALERGARVAGAVDPIAVFERDGWRCQFCGVRTPQRLRGTYERKAPELDHILPLSRGGEHSYQNTQCLCRACNGSKGDTPKGQMLLL